jgi:hypothetical protein
VEHKSTTQGASVWVDGQLLPAHTPALIPHLSTSREHLLEVHAFGVEAWSQRVQAEEGTTLAVRAQLRPARAHSASARVPHEGHFPLPAFEVRAAQHAFRVPPSSAARLRLDPSRTYSLRTEGKLAHGRGASIDTVAYYVEGGTALPARESFGLVGPQELRVRNVFALYLFVPDTSAQDNTGSLQVHVRETRSDAGATVVVDARQHTLTPGTEEGFTLHVLNAATVYEVTVRDTARPARTRGVEGEAVGRVLVLQDKGCAAEPGGAWKPGPARVVETGRATRFSGATRLRFTFPDDDLEDNAGALSVEVSALAGPRPAGC